MDFEIRADRQATRFQTVGPRASCILAARARGAEQRGSVPDRRDQREDRQAMGERTQRVWPIQGGTTEQCGGAAFTVGARSLLVRERPYPYPTTVEARADLSTSMPRTIRCSTPMSPGSRRSSGTTSASTGTTPSTCPIWAGITDRCATPTAPMTTDSSGQPSGQPRDCHGLAAVGRAGYRSTSSTVLRVASLSLVVRTSSSTDTR